MREAIEALVGGILVAAGVYTGLVLIARALNPRKKR